MEEAVVLDGVVFFIQLGRHCRKLSSRSMLVSKDPWEQAFLSAVNEEFSTMIQGKGCSICLKCLTYSSKENSMMLNKKMIRSIPAFSFFLEQLFC
jgi:hypothetical protein